eukprot:Rhum_TRINITY_DN21241_c0_g1::Rhum_TRINITY_DN21241_c0_g1_i1::g.173489::m.173489
MPPKKRKLEVQDAGEDALVHDAYLRAKRKKEAAADDSPPDSTLDGSRIEPRQKKTLNPLQLPVATEVQEKIYPHRTLSEHPVTLRGHFCSNTLHSRPSRAFAVLPSSGVAAYVAYNYGSRAELTFPCIFVTEGYNDPVGEPSPLASMVSLASTAEPKKAPPDMLNTMSLYQSAGDVVTTLLFGPAFPGTDIVPLAVLTVDGRLGTVPVLPQAASISVGKTVRYHDSSSVFVSAAFRPTTVVVAGLAKTYLMAGCADGTLQLMSVTRNGVEVAARCTAFEPGKAEVPHAMNWGDLATAPDLVTVLSSQSQVQLWRFLTEEGGAPKMHKVGQVNAPNNVPFPVQCPYVLGVTTDTRASQRIYFAQYSSLVEIVLAHKAQPVVTVTQTNHKLPIVCMAACSSCVLTSAYDGHILMHWIGDTPDPLACVGLSENPQWRVGPPNRGVLVFKSAPWQALSFAFSPSAMSVVVHLTLYRKDGTVQKASDTSFLREVYLFSAMDATGQIGMLRQTMGASRTSALAASSVAGTLSLINASMHSAGLRCKTSWLQATRGLLSDYRAALVTSAPLDVLHAYLKLTLCVLHLQPPWATTIDGHAVSPDPLFPATTVASTLSVVRSEILRISARASLWKLIRDTPSEMQEVEHESVLNMCRVLLAHAARGVSLWYRELAEFGEPAPAVGRDAPKADALRAPSITDPWSQTNLTLEELRGSLTVLQMDLRVVGNIVGSCGQEGESLAVVTKIVVTMAKRLLKFFEDSLPGHGSYPGITQEEVGIWQSTDSRVRITSACRLCEEPVHFLLSHSGLTTKCPRGHPNQVCPRTMLPRRGTCAVGKQRVCMMCGTAETELSALPSEGFAWLQCFSSPACPMCGYKMVTV